MKLGLATTTIHIPHALKLMRRMDGGAKFFVAGDMKTPIAAFHLCDEIAECYAIGLDHQAEWKCSEALGKNSLARRNIAFLEALKWGADVVISWDQDNYPTDMSWFHNFEKRLMFPFNGIKVTGADEMYDTGLGSVSSNRWFDPGTLLIPATRHRGFPHARHRSLRASPCTDVRVGVAAGLIIGDPDIDATTRIERQPDIAAVHILGSAGIVVDPNTWTVFNSQNTAVIRELIPAWFMAPGCGRHDDIFASLVVQRVMRERGYHAHFGPPFTFQQRNPHDLLVDLRAEIDGMSNVEKMAALLDGIQLPLKSVIEDTRIIYETLQHADWYPKQACTAAFAWLDDCEAVL